MNTPVPIASPVTPPQQTYATDLALVQAILARDRKATARFVELHSKRVHAYVWRRLTPRVAMVDDIVQEVFLGSWRALNSYTGQAPLENWILSIARFKVEDYYRQSLSKPLADIETEPETMALASNVDFDGDIDDLRNATRAVEVLEGLSYEYTLVLRWRYWEGQPAKAMAAASGRTEKAIERLLSRAREQFKLRWMAQERKGGLR